MVQEWNSQFVKAS